MAQADLHENVGVVYRNACNAVQAMQAMKSNEHLFRENHRVRLERIFYLTRITRYTVTLIYSCMAA